MASRRMDLLVAVGMIQGRSSWTGEVSDYVLLAQRMKSKPWDHANWGISTFVFYICIQLYMT